MRVDWTSPTLVSLSQLFKTFCLMSACWNFTCRYLLGNAYFHGNCFSICPRGGLSLALTETPSPKSFSDAQRGKSNTQIRVKVLEAFILAPCKRLRVSHSPPLFLYVSV